MNAARIARLLHTLSADYDMDTGCAEEGCLEDSVLLRSMDDRTEIVLRLELEEWEIHYEADEDDDLKVVVKLSGEGFGDDHSCDLTDMLDKIADFTADVGI